MKTILKFGILLAIVLIMSKCGKNPSADFSYSPQNPKAGQEVQFTNLSEDASSYSWNFGDMSIGKEKNPKHVYKNQGSYIVDLTVSSGLKSDTKTVTIVVIQ